MATESPEKPESLHDPEVQRQLDAAVAVFLGRVGLVAAQRELRRLMSHAALTRSGGSRRAASQLLGVDRRYVQKLIAEFGEPPPA
jgi:hypothetical protein